MIFIYPWNMESKGVRALRSVIPELRIIKHTGSNFMGAGKTVINWGASEVTPEVAKAARIINRPEYVALTVNKLKFFGRIDKLKNGPRIPKWTSDFTEAVKWVTEGHEVVGRRILNGSGGNGIVFSSDGLDSQFKGCKLYTKYVKKKEEYRVHIVFGKVLLVQRKALRTHDDGGNPIDKSTIDFRVRNLANGFIFVKNEVVAPDDVIVQALLTIKAFDLDFGAVDVIWNDHEQKAYILEVNTAPGLEGTTISDYAQAFRGVLLE